MSKGIDVDNKNFIKEYLNTCYKEYGHWLIKDYYCPSNFKLNQRANEMVTLGTTIDNVISYSVECSIYSSTISTIFKMHFYKIINNKNTIKSELIFSQEVTV